MKTIFLSILLVIFSFNIFSQNLLLDTIATHKILLGYEYFKGYKKINLIQMNKLMKTNEEAHKKIKFAYTNYAASLFVGLPGSVIFSSFTTFALFGLVDWRYISLGTGLIATSFYIDYLYFKRINEAVKIYNDSIKLK